MNEIMELLTKDILLLILPLLLLQLTLFAYCAVKIVKEGVRNLNKGIWLLICLLFSIVGPMLFLFLGRKEQY
ncbi:MAG TPA: hypothetical protein DHN33_01240 [Eubacteriaceae bacterium]|nr:hypothetical protein [Eubacteriaceae bacterium]